MRYYSRNSNVKQHKGKCIARVWEPSGCHHHQCTRNSHFGPNSEYCRQHASMIADGTHVPVPIDE